LKVVGFLCGLMGSYVNLFRSNFFSSFTCNHDASLSLQGNYHASIAKRRTAYVQRFQTIAQQKIPSENEKNA